MLVVRVGHHELADHSGPSLNLSLRSGKEECGIELDLLNLVLRVLTVVHELLDQWVDPLKFDLWLALKDLPDVKLIQDEGRLLI